MHPSYLSTYLSVHHPPYLLTIYHYLSTHPSYFSYIHRVPVTRACLLMDSPENWSRVSVWAWSIILHQRSPGPDTMSVKVCPSIIVNKKVAVLVMREKDQWKGTAWCLFFRKLILLGALSTITESWWVEQTSEEVLEMALRNTVRGQSTQFSHPLNGGLDEIL